MIELNKYNLNQYSAFFSHFIDETKKNLILFCEELSSKIDYFCKHISGINKADNVFYNGEILFDNKNYFDTRIFLDSNKSYFKTLDEKTIQNKILNDYGKALDSEVLKNNIHDLGIYSYFKKNKLLDKGNDLFCIALSLSTFQNRIVRINNEDILNDKNVLELINSDSAFGLTVITNKSDVLFNKNVMSSFDNLFVFTCEEVYKLDIKVDTIYYLSRKEKEYNEQIINEAICFKNNKLILAKSNKSLKDEYNRYYKIKELSFLEAIEKFDKEDN